MKETRARILAEVKTGKPTITQVCAFCRVMDKQNAEVDIFITLEPVTAGMRQEAQDMGRFEHNQKPTLVSNFGKLMTYTSTIQILSTRSSTHQTRGGSVQPRSPNATLTTNRFNFCVGRWDDYPYIVGFHWVFGMPTGIFDLTCL